jgi:2,3-bisphosphoglycerate-independent phosphoglycerate mutase
VVSGQWSVAAQIHQAMTLLDGLLGGALAALRPTDTLLLTSDHGNIESLAAPTHTRNPVPLLVVGPAAQAFATIESIMELADVIERVAVRSGDE